MRTNEAVIDDKYGIGTVLEQGNDRLTVDFDKKGTKTFVESLSQLSALPSDYPYATWTENLLGCHRDRRNAQWNIGDALLVAEKFWDEAWGKKRANLLEAAARLTGRTEDSLRQYMRVARVFPKEARHIALSFSHHQCVAAIEDKDKRDFWLQTAEAEKLNTEAFRHRVRGVTVKKISVYLPIGLYHDFLIQVPRDAGSEITLSDIIVAKLQGRKL
jgi:hypothetical protein